MLKLISKINPASFFVFAAITLGIVYFFLRPAMQSPDEFNHFLRAYQISEGKFLPEKKDQRLGGEVPVCFAQYMSLYITSAVFSPYKLTSEEIAKGYEIKFSDKEKVFKDFPNTSNYSAVAYIPQALTLFILRQFHFSVGMMYDVTRVFTFFIWLLAMWYIIKTLPSYKWLFVMVFLLPMNMYLASSITADTVTNILSFMLIAIVLKFSFYTKPITKKEIALLFLLCIFLPLSKTIYVSLLLILLILPAHVFTSKLRKYVLLGSIVLVAFLCAALWTQALSPYFIGYDDYNLQFRPHTTIREGADYHKQKAHLLAHGTFFPKVLYNTTVKTADFYLSSYIGHFGAYMDSGIPFWFFINSYLVILFVAVTEKTKIYLSFFKKLIIFSAAILTFSLIVLSQHLIWNAVGRDIADSIQGRYLVPVMPLLFILCNVSWIKIKLNVAPIVILFVFLANGITFNLLYTRYYKETCISKIEVSCDVEKINAEGFLLTSNDSILLKGTNVLTTKVHRSGNHSLVMPPNSSLSAVYKVKNIYSGSFLEMRAWQKASKGQLIFTGEGINCNGYYFAHDDAQLKENNGWERMRMVLSMPAGCDSSESLFYLQNPTADTIYFDDLWFSIKKIN
ncbi:DUF2142 domain-containing protein [Aurantibacillus circumpalustris]|uniref:DUF2142 domain-containing protein n=1 Tax=Aurantibacillus circumpalustris TaxID=3036359 RepID=UPI00295B6A4C|nr:DUF2142 domain-containing protein [Aurantibacillus circumpalustris]